MKLTLILLVVGLVSFMSLKVESAPQTFNLFGFEGTFDAITEVKGKDADGKIKSNSEFENKAEEIIRGMVNKYLTKKKQRKNPKSNSKSKSSDETIANVLENVRK